MEIKLPKKAEYIIQKLLDAGYEAYAVGGCVRDTLLKKEPQDWDITTSAKPQEVKALFKRTIDTGIMHGTVTVMLEQEGFEVTTYRIDGEYEDARHPKEVVFTPNLLEDLKRRDFTINAMAYNPKDGLIDAFDGAGDLKRGRIRCVGNPKERFNEDALRMLRAVRFAAQLGFEIEENTKSAICELSAQLAKISAERIQTELVKLITSNHPEEMKTLYETGITAVILPEFDKMMETTQNNPHHKYTVGGHTIASMQNIPSDKVLRLTMLLHDVAKPVCKITDEDGEDHFYGHQEKGSEMSVEILRRLKFDNDTIAKVKRLVKWHDEKPSVTPKSVRKAVVRMGQEAYPSIFMVKRADIFGQSDYKRNEKLNYVAEFEACYNEIIKKQECITLKNLAVNGKDLLALGMEKGPALGEMLSELFELVLENPEKNTKEELLAEAEKRFVSLKTR